MLFFVIYVLSQPPHYKDALPSSVIDQSYQLAFLTDRFPYWSSSDFSTDITDRKLQRVNIDLKYMGSAALGSDH